MAYQLVTAADQDDLLDKFVDFAIANAGFSNKATGIVASGWSDGRSYVKLTKGLFTWIFAKTRATEDNPDFNFYVQMSFDSAINTTNSDIDETPDGPLAVSCWNFDGPFGKVYMYTDGLSVHCAVELSVGIYTHFSIGSITKTETFTGGEFLAGFAGRDVTATPNHSRASPMFPGGALSISPLVTQHNPQTEGSFSTYFGSKIHAVPLSGASTQYSRFAQFGRAANNNQAAGEAVHGITNSLTLTDGSSAVRANSQTQRTPLWPNIIRLHNQTNDLWRISGHIPITRFCFMDYLNPGDIIFDEWQVFPYCQKNGDATICVNSGNLGIAYRRV